ncbi:hypothetical protein NQ317_008543 [Molorchus minor]|uniref:Gustatory receptor n=1 Tax=Molorchus minor TaxID=1323400 RepID=A0ABQ9J2T2_9CUCU|nr:hypothetical protein NQ317_008543 [Molorchus minor]
MQVIPYCYINTITYVVGGAWYIYCDLIGTIATIISSDFQQALKHIGPATRVADYRSLWMILSRIIRDVGNAFGYTLTFLCLYLFCVITLTIYGLMSQLQEGLGVKDIGLAVTAASATALLFFICDEAHYASNCVRVLFQKRLLLVELNWMNDDAQQEVAGGETLPVIGVHEAEFQLGRTVFRHQVFAGITDDVLMGLELMKKHGFQLNLQERSIKTGQDEIIISMPRSDEKIIWINLEPGGDDGQVELIEPDLDEDIVKKGLLINMFLRATEMSHTDMSLCGFFDVNRNVFKSVSIA